MDNLLTAAELIAFEADIAVEFNAGKIRAPVHLSGGNEQQLIDIFKQVKENDWICTTWRSHYHCLLKGIPPERLKADIMAGRSITLTYPEHRIISSAIVGGIIPIAVGVAWSIKYRYERAKDANIEGLVELVDALEGKGNEHVWVFVGDMTAKTGIFWECLQYANGHSLPIVFVTERNGLSVCTDTKSVWGDGSFNKYRVSEMDYEYKLPWPHAGAGKRVQF